MKQMRAVLLASMWAVTFGDGQHQIPVFSDFAVGHFSTSGEPSFDPKTYATHDHTHIHDHGHDHHSEAAHHDHHHHVTMDGDVLHHCEDGRELSEDGESCICHQSNGIYQSVCGPAQPCDSITGICQPASCFDACRWAFSGDDQGDDRDGCYNDECGCTVPAGSWSEEEKCQLDCADCGDAPLKMRQTVPEMRMVHDQVMEAIFGGGLFHASAYNVKPTQPLESLDTVLLP